MIIIYFKILDKIYLSITDLPIISFVFLLIDILFPLKS
jgi:hypothetical protein